MNNSKKTERQEKILDAALKLFTERGYFNTTVNDIQFASKMSVGSLYNYFENKESIAVTLYSNLENCLYEALCEIEQNNDSMHDCCLEAVRHIFETTERTPSSMQYLLYTKHREFMPVEKTAFASLPFLKMKSWVEKGQKNREVRNIEPNVAMNAIFGSAIRMVFLRIDGILESPLPEYLDECWECSWRGVSADA
ncbi:MAG: TetR/AcrR family transcriptional regulator [Desulfocapsaceae bacterium]